MSISFVGANYLVVGHSIKLAFCTQALFKCQFCGFWFSEPASLMEKTDNFRNLISRFASLSGYQKFGI